MGRYRCHRRPTTTQERRANGKRNYLCFDEYKVPLRASRNMSNLVEAWDDVTRSSIYDRSWKKFRKTQWKPKKDIFDGKTSGQLLIEGLEEFLKDLQSGIDLTTKYRITNFDHGE